MKLTPVRVLTVVCAVLVLAVTTPMFASPISHVGGSGSTVAPTHAYGSSLGPDPLVYSQNPDYNGAYSSQNDTNGFGNFATAYDNFTLGATYNITEFAWVGSYFNPPQQGLITGATLTFYADAGGAPGAVLWQGSGSGNFGETFLGFDNVGDPTYLYDGLLGTPFVAQAGTTYWVSIVPDLGFPPQWGWETATGGDGAAYQCFFGTCGAIPNDVSFALYGNQTTTPEPSALILFGSGLVGLGSLRRRLR